MAVPSKFIVFSVTFVIFWSNAATVSSSFEKQIVGFDNQHGSASLINGRTKSNTVPLAAYLSGLYMFDVDEGRKIYNVNKDIRMVAQCVLHWVSELLI